MGNTAKKRAFIRGVWGIHDTQGSRQVKRRFKIDFDIEQTIENKFAPESIIYVFGEENCKKIKEYGFDNIRMISKQPKEYELNKEQYRHKLEIFKIAMQEYDEIVYLDWDCRTQKKIQQNFWDIMGQKEYCQANLQCYRKQKCYWRKGGFQRLVPNAGFVYIRDKKLPDEIIKCWEIDKLASAEPPIARAMDNRYGGWCGTDKYWELFEPETCNLSKGSIFKNKYLIRDRIENTGEEFIKDPDKITFIHYHGGSSTTMFKKWQNREIEKNNIK